LTPGDEELGDLGFVVQGSRVGLGGREAGAPQSRSDLEKI
jgi:hypothetical protein